MNNFKITAAICAAVLIFSACAIGGSYVNQLVTTIEAGEEYDATHFVVPKDENATISVTKDNIEIDKPGKYEVVYELTSETLKYYEASIFVTVKDTTPPAIKEKNIVTALGSEFDVKKAVVAEDIVDGDVSELTEIESGSVDINNVGQYELKVKVIDKTGNEAVETVVVKVEDTAAEARRKGYVFAAINSLRGAISYPESLKISSTAVCENCGSYEALVKISAELMSASGKNMKNDFYIGVNSGNVDSSQFTNNAQKENKLLWNNDAAIAVEVTQ